MKTRGPRLAPLNGKGKKSMELEKRIRDIIRNAEPNDGIKYPHWLCNGWFLIVRKSKVKLYHSDCYDSRRAKHISDEPRNALGYSNIATAIGL